LNQQEEYDDLTGIGLHTQKGFSNNLKRIKSLKIMKKMERATFFFSLSYSSFFFFL
jgi:hypothetical protein